MRDGPNHAARISMLINATPADIYLAFVDPKWLTRFWLRSADLPLAVGRTAKWQFMVEGASIETTATQMDEDRCISWSWSDGTTVEIDLEELEGSTGVTIVIRGFTGDPSEQVDAALNACEGFAIVLCDLKTLLETGTSASLVAAKAKLIQHRSA